MKAFAQPAQCNACPCFFGHHDPRQVAKMRMIGAFLLAIVCLLRLFTGFGRLVDHS